MMASNNILQPNSILLTDENDPDETFFNNHISLNANTPYLTPNSVNPTLNPNTANFSLLHLNIRSLNKNFENFKQMLSDLQTQLTVICLSETWCQENSAANSSFQLPGYTVIHQERKHKRGGGLCVFIRNSVSYEILTNYCQNNNENETLCFKILNEKNKKKNIIINFSYCPPGGDKKQFRNYIKTFISNPTVRNKLVYLVGDFNINSLDYETNNEVKNFFDLLFRNGFAPIINKPTRVTKHTATVIDHIITNNFQQELELKTCRPG